MRLIDMDTHFAPKDEFEYMPAEYRHLAPRWLSYGSERVALIAPARPQPAPTSGVFNPDVHLPGNFEVEARLRDMDALGVERQLLNPEFSQYCFEIEPRLAAAMCRSANTAFGKVLKQHPGRFVGCAVTPTQDIRAAVEEAERALEAGFPTLFVKAPQGGKNLGDLHFWPLYEFANDHHVPILVHATNQDLGAATHTERLGAHWGVWVGMLSDFLFCVCSLIYDGVFDAFPNLQFCFAESGATWLPWTWDRLALTYEVDEKSRGKTKRHPTEYFGSNIWVTVDPTEQSLGHLVERFSSKNLMLGTDYPHGDITGRGHGTDRLGDIKRTHIDLLLEREDLSHEAKEDIAYKNALRFLGERVS
jgi:predicted TIM-barrel fold metal-dependent hydrolase